jgi:hypothetical protein
VPAGSADRQRDLDRPLLDQIGTASAIPEGTPRRVDDLTGFWGGDYMTPANERVTIYSSNAYTIDPAANQRWADFLGQLMHGPELSRVTIYFATAPELDRLCHGEADLVHYVLGCYGSDTIIAIGEDTGSISAEAVLTHEYGHHIAANRSNAPWRGLEWGPKQWASAMNICAMARAHVVFPGDESLLYRLNPGEGFAEAYRWATARTAQDPIGTWDVLDTWLYPGHDAIQAIADSVLRPWMRNRVKTFTGTFTTPGSSLRRFHFVSGLDGAFTVSVRGTANVRIAISDGRRVVARGRSAARTTICGGFRHLTVRLTGLGRGTYRLAVSLP